MDFDKLFGAGIDYEAGVKRFCGKAELYGKYLFSFPEDGTYRKLREALLNEEYEEAFHCAHTLEGIAGNLSLQELSDKLHPLVQALRAKDISRLQELFLSVEESYAKAIDALR